MCFSLFTLVSRSGCKKLIVKQNAQQAARSRFHIFVTAAQLYCSESNLHVAGHVGPQSTLKQLNMRMSDEFLESF
jgi:hypothetical protein